MDQDEFREWLRHHQSCFVGIGRWLSGFPEAGGEVNRPDVLRRWFYVLKDVELDDATAASDAMLSGDLPEPRSFDRHVTAIRGKALRRQNERQRQFRPRPVDGQQTVKCKFCMDDGWVAVWHPLSVAAATDGTLGQLGTLSTMVVVCRCPAGRKHESCGATVFDERKMLPVRCKHDPNEQKELIEFVARRNEWKPTMSYEDVCEVSETCPPAAGPF